MSLFCDWDGADVLLPHLRKPPTPLVLATPWFPCLLLCVNCCRQHLLLVLFLPQVIDLMGELTARGLDPATAAAVLDSGTLCVALTFWVAAAPGSNSSSGSPPSTPVRNASAASGPTCGGASSSSGSTHDFRHATPAQFAAALMLDDGQVPLRSFQTFVVTESSHHFFSKRLAVQPGEAWRR